MLKRIRRLRKLRKAKKALNAWLSMMEFMLENGMVDEAMDCVIDTFGNEAK